MVDIGVYKDIVEGPRVCRNVKDKTFSVEIRDLNCIREDKREWSTNFVMGRFSFFMDELEAVS